MRRGRKFPLLSCVIVLALTVLVGSRCAGDTAAARVALDQVRASVARLFQGLSLLSASAAEGKVVFSDSFLPQATPVPTQNANDPIPMLVNGDHPVPEGYVPGDLVRMRDYCDESVVYIKGSEIDGDRAAVDALLTMLRAAIAQGVSDWQVSAGYRSVQYQQQLWDDRAYEYRQQGLSGIEAQRATAKYVAKPGCSEHHTGLAFDMTVPGESFPLTEQSAWLAEHCWDYGFIIRYTEEKREITGISAEPWHIRYVGQPHARLMREKGWCLEEYIDSLGIL